MIQLAVFFILGIGAVFGGEPVVECPAPRSPDNGQAFMYREGQVVKYVCEPGFVLQGREVIRCVDGAWEVEAPECRPIGDVMSEDTHPTSAEEIIAPPLFTPRPLFNWGSDVEEDVIKDENNVTSDENDEMPMSDEARRVRMVVYPRRMARVIQARVARLNRATELEEEERRRSGGGSTTTIHLQAPPSVLYVRRTGKSSDQDNTRTAALHMTVEDGENKEQVQVVNLPRAAATQSDKGEDYIRQQYYWMAHNYYNYPRQSSSLQDYVTVGHPYHGLSESQWQWIHSLHPELRDQYLRDIYGVRTNLDAESARAQAFLRRYGDAYLYHPYYYRQPAVASLTDQTSFYDYTCNQAGSNFVKAPKLRNAHIARYDRRQNPNAPNNHYLAAVYRCNPGYVMLDTRFTELFCSRRSWIGTEPMCVETRA